METYAVVCAAGTLRAQDNAGAVHFPHRWTDGGVEVSAAFTGAHLLHTAVAGCVLNDLYREASALGLVLAGVRVTAWGGFDEAWASKGIEYRVELDAALDPPTLADLLRRVDEVAEIPRAVRTGARVARVPSRDQ